MTDDIVAFIKIRLHECQAAALDALKHWPPGDEIAGQVDSILVGAHIQRQNPQRTLRGVEAKRRQIETLEGVLTPERPEWMDDEQWRVARAGGELLVSHLFALMASEWSTHEDYRSEWTP